MTCTWRERIEHEPTLADCDLDRRPFSRLHDGVRVPAAAAGTRRLRRRERSSCRRIDSRGAAAGGRLRDHLDRGRLLPVDDLAAVEQSGSRHPGARPEALTMTAGHFIFIPSVLLIGVVIGWILGSRAARDAYAMELRKREEKASRPSRPS